MNIKTMSLLLTLSLSVLVAGLLPQPALADYEGVVTGDDVYVRAAPSTSSTQNRVTKVSEPQRVTVTKAYDEEWLEILPTKGCYSVIHQRYVKLNPDGKTGVVIGDGVNVRAAGTLIRDNFFIAQGRLNRGDVVLKLGSARDLSNQMWYIIKPPSFVRFYISSRYVTKASEYKQRPQAQPETAQPETPEGQTATTAPAKPLAPKIVRPVRKEVQTLKSIRELEKALMAESKKPVDKRDFNALLAKAEKLDVPKNSRFRPVYDSLLGYINDEIELAQQRKAATALVSEALSPVGSTPQVQEKKAKPEKYDLQGILEVSELYSAGPGGKRYVVRDANTYRIHGYVQDKVGTRRLRNYVGKNVGIIGKPTLDKKLSLTIFNVDEIYSLEEATPELEPVMEPQPDQEVAEPAEPQPAPETEVTKPEPETKPEVSEMKPAEPVEIAEPKPEPTKPEPWQPDTVKPETPKPAPAVPQPWTTEMTEPTPLVPPTPEKTVKPLPVEKPEPAKPVVEPTPVVIPEPTKPAEPAPIEKPEPVKPVVEPTPVVVPEPTKPAEPAPIEKPEPAKPVVEPTPVVIPEPTKPAEPAPVEKPEPAKPVVEPAQEWIPEPIELKPIEKPEPIKPVEPAGKPGGTEQPVEPAPIEVPGLVKPIEPVEKPTTAPEKLEPPKPEPIKVSPLEPEPITLPSGRPQPIKTTPVEPIEPVQPVESVKPVGLKPTPVKIAPIAPVIIQPEQKSAKPLSVPAKTADDERLYEVEWD